MFGACILPVLSIETLLFILNVSTMSVRNKVTLIGHLGKDPEFTTTQNGRSIARFSMATNESYTNSAGELVEKTEWHRCIVWGKKAEAANKYLHKGKEVAVDGKLRHRTYEDKNGIRRSISEVEVTGFAMVGKKSDYTREVAAPVAN